MVLIKNLWKAFILCLYLLRYGCLGIFWNLILSFALWMFKDILELFFWGFLLGGVYLSYTLVKKEENNWSEGF